MAEEGSITIGIGANTDKFDKQIAKLEKDMKKTEDKLSLKAKVFISSEGELLKQKREVEDLKNTYNSLTERIAHLNEIKNGAITPTLKDASDLQHYEQIIAEQNKVESNLARAEQKQNSLNIKYERAKAAYKEISDRVKDYKTQIENVKIQRQIADVEELKQGFNNVGISLESSIKKVARLALGIFGLRGAYMALRRASSNLASYDQQYATNLEYIRYALTQMIAPVLQWIVNLAAKLLGYINAIMQGWFGINLFSRGSAKNFQKMKAGAGGVAKAVKEIKKQLAGFDEINMLTDQSDSGAGGGGGAGGVAPDFDLSKFQGEVPDWLQWIIDNRDLILSILAGIGAGLLFLKLGELAKNLGLIKGEMLGIKALGFGVMVAGIVYTIQSLLKYLKEPTWENFGKIIQGIGIAIVGLGILIGNVPLIVAGAIILIVGLIIKHWEQIKSFLQGGIDWLKGKSDWVHRMFGDTIGSIYDLFVDNLQQILNFFDSFFKMIKGIFDGIIKFIKGVFTGNWQMVWEGIKQIFSSLWEGIKGMAISSINIIKNDISAWVEVIKVILQTLWNIMKSGARTAVNVVINVFNSLWNAIRNVFSGIVSFFGNIVNRIVGLFGNLGSTAGEAIAGAFRAVVNGVLRAVERILNSPIRSINRLISVINAVPRNKFKYTTNIQFT